MIHVDRTRVILPTAVMKRLMADHTQLIAFNRSAKGGSKAYQQRAFDYKSLSLTRPILLELFAHKCAYCETSLVGQLGDIDNFRPKASIKEEDGKVIREGYWWLAHEWENIYLACATCNRVYKVNKFPIHGKRAKPFAKGRRLLAEKPLLLDPCFDEPSHFLWFTRDGLVDSVARRLDRATGLGSDPLARALITIDVLGLNREELVAERRRLFHRVSSVLATWSARSERALMPLLEQGQPHLGAVAQWVGSHVALNPGKSWSPWLGERLSQLRIHREIVGELARKESMRRGRTRLLGGARKQRSKSGRAPRPGGPPAVVSGPEDLPEAVVAFPACIKHLSLRNFKAIRRLDLDIPVVDVSPLLDAAPNADPATNAAPTSRTGWFVLLGENAVGKSSVLEAVALAVMGKDYLDGLVREGRLSLGKLVHLPPGRDPTKNRRTCVVRLLLEPSNLGEIELRITRTSFRFVQGGSPLPTLIRGYGFVRLLPRKGEGADRSLSLARCDNLFDPRIPLSDAERWMAGLPYDDTAESSFDIAARTILKLLPRTPAGFPTVEDKDAAASYLKPKDGKVVMVLKGSELALDQLSSGYQSVIALAADIMSGMPAERLFDMREARGLVLLDEIGTQLHPRWRMHAISDLRDAFPGMQFIATTHEPLCLKGVSRQEVAVLRREGSAGDVNAITQGFQDPRTLRADQLLTSPLFGLDSTIDPEVDQMFQRYFALLARKGKDETSEARRDRERLEQELAPHRGLGYTRSDQLVYALLEEYLATEGIAARSQARAVSEPVRRQIFDIWRTVRSHRVARS